MCQCRKYYYGKKYRSHWHVFIMYIPSFELFWESLHQNLISLYHGTKKDLITSGKKNILFYFFYQSKQKGNKCSIAMLLSSYVPCQGCTDTLQLSLKSPSPQHGCTWDFWLFVKELCPRAGLWIVKLAYLIYYFVERHKSPKSPFFCLLALFNETKFLTAKIISPSFFLWRVQCIMYVRKTVTHQPLRGIISSFVAY